MKTIVLKFGGTSVSSEERRIKASEHVKRVISKGYRVVVVVSAMGRRGDAYATDTLLGMVGNGEASAEARDLLISCGETISACVFADVLAGRGVPAVPLTGPQAGLIAEGAFGSANIVDMNTHRVLELLDAGFVPVIAGFQAADGEGRVVTIGRGGSDISAVEIGGYIGADRVDIYTDVLGIAVTDPEIVPGVRYLSHVKYSDMMTLAEWGAKVIHPKAVAAAMHHMVPVQVRSTFCEEQGTWLSGGAGDGGLVGIALTNSDGRAIITVVCREAPQCVWESVSDMLLGSVRKIGEDAVQLTVPASNAEVVIRKLYTLLSA